MKILLYSHFFIPESGAAPIRLKYFADALNKHDLVIISPIPNYPHGKKIKNFRELLSSDYRTKIKYIPLIIPSNKNHSSRALSYLSYMVTSFLYAYFKLTKPKIVVCSSPPITTAFIASLYSRIRRTKLILDVRDMWPQIGIELGVLRNQIIIRMLKKVEKYILNRADKIIVTAKGDKQNLINRKYPKEKIEVIYNGADTDRFVPFSEIEIGRIRNEHDIPQDKVVLIYFGSFNYGMNDLDTLAEALLELDRQKLDFHFLAVGNGEQKEKIVSKLSSTISLQSFDSLGIEKISKILGASDISLIPRKNIKRDTGGNIPVKCFESWAAGVPVVLSSIKNSEVSAIFKECRSGILVEAGIPFKFAEAIRELIDQKHILKALGAKGRDFVLNNFDRKKQSQKLTTIVEEVVSD